MTPKDKTPDDAAESERQAAVDLNSDARERERREAEQDAINPARNL